MRVKVLVSLLGILMLIVVAGCGPGAAPSTAGQSSGAAQEGSDAAVADAGSAAEVEITGATPGERAIQGLKAMNLPAGTKFTVFSEDLTIKMAEVNAEEFNKQTGLVLETQTAPFLEHRTKIMQDAINKAGAYDMVILQTSWMGDFYNAGYLTPLTEWANKYNPDIEDMIAPFNEVWSHFFWPQMKLLLSPGQFL